MGGENSPRQKWREGGREREELERQVQFSSTISTALYLWQEQRGSKTLVGDCTSTYSISLLSQRSNSIQKVEGYIQYWNYLLKIMAEPPAVMRCPSGMNSGCAGSSSLTSGVNSGTSGFMVTEGPE